MAANVHRSPDHRSNRRYLIHHAAPSSQRISHHGSAISQFGSAVHGINELHQATRPNEYVDVTAPVSSRNVALRSHRPTSTRQAPQGDPHHLQTDFTNLNLCTCQSSRPLDLTVDLEGMAPPLLPRLPRRKIHRAKSLPTHRRPPPAPPVDRGTKPPLHKVASMNTPPCRPTTVLQADKSPVTIHSLHNHSVKNNRRNHSDKVQRQNKAAVTLPHPDILPNDSSIPTSKSGKNYDCSSITTAEKLPNCEQCKCVPLPETWLCDGTCRLSADTCIDLTSCMCVAKGVMTRGCDAEVNEKIADPCSCTPSTNCCRRWTTLAFLSLCFPCLLCYLPLKCCKKAALERYQDSKCRHNNCQCNH